MIALHRKVIGVFGCILLGATPMSAMSSLLCPDLSDEEVVDLAIDAVISSPAVGSLRVARESYKLVREGFEPYQSVEEFRALNKDCCTLSVKGTDNYEMSLFERVRQSFQSFVIIEYSIKSDIGNGTELFPASGTMVAVSSCGSVIDLD
mgnify:CR=1 FL=1